MLKFHPKFLRFSAFAACVVALFLAGCSSGKRLKKPVVENRSPIKGAAHQKSLSDNTAKEHAADEQQSATYVVKAGDTLAKIGLETGNNWRDIAQWNRLEDPNRIEVGQVLRLSPDTSITTDEKAAAAPSPVVGPEKKSNDINPSLKSGPVSPAEDGLAWVWPSASQIKSNFDAVRNKGLVFSGKLGDPVYAAGDGRVVYAGSGLRGYGKLIIIRHNQKFISAYAHNDSLLVSEEQIIKRGQKIATMGNTDADEYKLHFEIRRLGKPVDPKSFLPPK